jgi:uncharacterized membrane protein
MKQQAQQLWTLLLQSKVVEGELPQASKKLQSPWYVKVLLGFSGWIASLFLFVFLGMLLHEIFDNSLAALFVGAVVIGLAYSLLRAAKNEFVEHLALAGSLAGQVLLVYAINGLVDNVNVLFWMLVVLMQALLAVLIPNFIHRVMTSFAATFAFSMLMMQVGLPQFITATVLLMAVVCWVNEFRWVRYMDAFRAIGYGLILALLLFKGSLMYGFLLDGFFSIYDYAELMLPFWVGDILIAVVILYLVWNILQRYYTDMFEKIPATALLATLLLCAASVEMLGLNVGIAILLLGFLGSNRILIGLGIVSLLFFISSYYYFINTTLLEKSQSLFFIGITLLIMRWLMLNVITKKKEAEHA